MTQEPARREEVLVPEQHAAAGAEEKHIYTYEPAGIREQSGSIPAWLKMVTVSLMVWGIYYSIRYWDSY